MMRRPVTLLAAAVGVGALIVLAMLADRGPSGQSSCSSDVLGVAGDPDGNTYDLVRAACGGGRQTIFQGVGHVATGSGRGGNGIIALSVWKTSSEEVATLDPSDAHGTVDPDELRTLGTGFAPSVAGSAIVYARFLHQAGRWELVAQQPDAPATVLLTASSPADFQDWTASDRAVLLLREPGSGSATEVVHVDRSDGGERTIRTLSNARRVFWPLESTVAVTVGSADVAEQTTALFRLSDGERIGSVPEHLRVVGTDQASGSLLAVDPVQDELVSLSGPDLQQQDVLLVGGVANWWVAAVLPR